MVVCADTSFLYSLYAYDAHSAQALAWTRSSGQAISISELTEYELGNALRCSGFRHVLPAGQASAFLAQYEADRALGLILGTPCNLAAVISHAKRLSATYTLFSGHRGFDILHVAAAIEMGASAFLTFDGKQKQLAIAEGFSVPV